MSSKPSKESKYERVEKISVDKDGSNVVKEVGEDRGREDPGMNYQDKRPANLVPGAPSGMVPRLDGERISSNSESASERSSLRSHTSNASGFVDASLANNNRQNAGEFSSSSSSRTTVSSGGPIAPATALDRSRIVGNEERSSSSSIRSQNSPPRNENMNLNQRNENMNLNQRTVVTETHVIESPRPVPIQPHREVREQHEVIRHESSGRGAETTNVTIPITRFESAAMESTRHGRTFTEDKELTIPAAMVAPQIQAMQQVNFSGGTSAEIRATTDVSMASEAEIRDMGPEEYARYRQKVEALARQHEMEASQKAAEYRNEVERDAELIRQTLERQHIRDIEFRKDMVEANVDRQQTEIQLEAEYAMRALEREREIARSALEKAKASTNIDVNIDSAIGTTHSQGRVTTTAEHRSNETKI